MIVVLLGKCSDLPIRERIGVPVIILTCLFFVGIGIDFILHPKRHMNAYLKRGGEMLREFNEMGVQFVGLALSCFGGWVLYEFVRSVWNDCFR